MKYLTTFFVGKEGQNLLVDVEEILEAFLVSNNFVKFCFVGKVPG